MHAHVRIYVHVHAFLDADPSVLPRRRRPVFGMELLWQPEVVHPYLALIDKCGASSETLEAAVGAIQNLTACSWKVRSYMQLTYTCIPPSRY